MRRLLPETFRGRTLRLVSCLLLCCLGLSAPSFARSKAKLGPPTVRWDESTPGCTFSRSEDGKYHYGLWSDDAGVTIIVDSQELAKVRRRHEPFFGVLVEVRFRGPGEFDINRDKVTLEFVKHFKLVQSALDPEKFAETIQSHADQLDYDTAREVERHPEQQEVKETYSRAFQKDTAELIEFVSKDSLRSTHLDAGNPQINGWILFNTGSKWISKWKKQEEFVLRMPLDGKIFEFPFKLPPKEGELVLRHRD